MSSLATTLNFGLARKLLVVLTVAAALMAGTAAPAKADGGINLIINSQQDYLRACTNWYVADWGGWEKWCSYDRYDQSMALFQVVKFYDWDGQCARLYKFWQRLMDSYPRNWNEYRINQPFCAVPGT
jgi:hypothetical protein